MEDISESWKSDPNKRTLLVIRRSGYGQKENTSGETQRRENVEYAQKQGLEVVQIESIIETAFKRKERKKFHALIQHALKEKIRHIVFFWSSREARNLTDVEKHEELIRAGKIIIHHVTEGRVYWKKTPDADFAFREMNAVMNKGESRGKSTTLKASLRTKALEGWWPYRWTALGYIHYKDRDKYGNGIKGTAKVIVDPDTRNVRIVQREFELRAQGTSYDEIRRINLAAKVRQGGKEEFFVPAEMRETYSRHAIEARLKNEFYWGFFHLKDDPIRYPGKHEKIIPAQVLKAVEAVNNGNACKYRVSSVAAGDDIFRGWLTCAHPECQRLITYEKKEKILKSTGEAKVYHLYRCSNSRKVHGKLVYSSEEKIFAQFEPSVDRIDITKEFAADLSNEIKNSFEKQRTAIKKQMEGFRIVMQEVREQRRNVVNLFTMGKLAQVDYEDQIALLEKREDDCTDQLEHLNLLITDSGEVAVQKVLELAIGAKELWKTMDRQERVDYLKNVCSNPTLDDLTLHYRLEKPFEKLAEMKGNRNWRILRDSNHFTSLGEFVARV
ncbi:MAG: recombinase family protein [Bdellovibrionaceae bacterium]|nr:recombinase family protein [Pseudobdellovibrionaceae bacterium]